MQKPPDTRARVLDDSPKTFVRGLRILQALECARPHGLDVPTLARLTGTQRSTVYRYLDVLVAMGYARRTEGRSTFVYQKPVMAGEDADQALLQALAAAMRRISDETQDSTFLVRREGSDAYCIHRELGSYPVQVLAVNIGHRQPMGVGAAGLALLAGLPDHDVQDILDANEPRLSQYGGMTRRGMQQLVKTTRERGWSAVGNAAVAGVLGVGVAVPAVGAGPRYAVSVSGLVMRLPLSRQRVIIELIQKELLHACSGLSSA